ncbi:LysR family transcriptional regulator [uncultured Roseobacter sp.]|uniref:LysR family transcriptional regulator n=1 Tax=uncultured Roseobacter sp. TaxID=114847 RepID=UPI002639B761|nr:LysR family transcriptional regulator [uncultured Roseobacter sp.]
MNNLPSLISIEAFISVAETGAFKDGARRLNLTPSAASKAVTRLEETLGVKLIHRTTRSVSLTPEGERYLEGAKRLIADALALGAEVSDTASDPVGRLTVSAPAAFGRMCLVPALDAFHREWPQVEIELWLDDRAVDLAGDAVDIAIRAGALSDRANLIARRVFDDQLVLCASPDYWDLHGMPEHPDDLAKHDCLNFRNRRTGRVMQWHFTQDGEVVSKTYEGSVTIDDGESVGRAARAGLGVSQMPSFMAAEGIKRGKLVEALEEFRPPPTPFTALYLDRRLVSPRIRVFIDFILQAQSKWDCKT